MTHRPRRDTVDAAADAVARGGALFTTALALLAVVAELRGRTSELSLWWVDLRDASEPLRLGILLVTAAVLGAWAIHPLPGRWLRTAASVVSGVVAVLAVRDVIGFYRAIDGGQVQPLLVVPLSAVLAGLYALLALWIIRHRTPRAPIAGRAGIGLLVATAAWVIAFPIAQMLWFGTTDYRRPADAAVAFGARVYASGVPSPLLGARIDTAVDVYREGLVPTLVMSGGDGADGFNEARVMAQVAEAAGVDPGAIVIDPQR